MQRLQHRRDFLAAAKAVSQSMPGVVIQARNRADEQPPRIGFTCTKKLGNAVTRNRIRRRMREAARLTLPGIAKTGFDYVMIGRVATADRDFDALKKDIISALQKLHTARPANGPVPPAPTTANASRNS